MSLDTPANWSEVAIQHTLVSTGAKKTGKHKSEAQL